jgi:E3 ubiquitin-protein ligase UBR7
MSAPRDETLSMDQVIEEQERLREEAAEAIPFTFESCTWGSTEEFDRQPIYSCLSCRSSTSTSTTSSSSTENLDASSTRAGICAGCSVACHSDCELVELFTRRNFTCDCGSTRLSSRQCNLTLRKNDKSNEGNKYDNNFDGIFCSCRIRYDPETE